MVELSREEALVILRVFDFISEEYPLRDDEVELGAKLECAVHPPIPVVPPEPPPNKLVGDDEYEPNLNLSED